MGKDQNIMSDQEYRMAINDLRLIIEQSGFVFKNIYGIPRGGLPIAVHLSHLLNIPLTFEPGEESLVIDDISDRGMTLKQFSRNNRFKKTATLLIRKGTRFIPNFYAGTVLDKKFIVFPWER